MPRIVPFCATLLAAFAANALLQAQGTRSDYDRAAGSESGTRDRIFRAEVLPQWLDSRRCWYRVESGAGRHDFVKITLDSESKATRAPLFDVGPLAEQLSRALGEKIDPAALPITQLEFENDIPTFRAGGKSFALENGALVVRETKVRILEPLPTERRPQRSRNGGAGVRIVFVNDLTEAVELAWIDTRGERHVYATLEPAGRFAQNTFVGHLWVAQRAGQSEPIAFMARRGAQDDDEAHIVEPRAKNDALPASEPGIASPDGKLRVVKREYDLFVVEQATGEERRVTTNGSQTWDYQERVDWSPDSTRFVAYALTPGDRRQVTLVESSPRDRLQPKVRSFHYDKPGDRLDEVTPVLIDPGAGVIPITPPDLFPHPIGIGGVRFDPDGRTFSFVYDERGHQRLLILEVEAATGQAAILVEERSDTFIDSSQKTILEYLDRDHTLLIDSERSGYNHLYRIDRATRSVRNAVTAGQFVVRRLVRVDEVRGFVEFMALGLRPDEDPYHEHLCRVNLDGSNFQRLTEGDGTHKVEFSPDRDYFIDRWSRVDQPPVSELRRASDGALLLELERADASALLATGWTLPERFRAKGRDGTTDIYGLIVRPTNFDPKKRYPIVEKIYAGPHDYHVPKEFSRLVQEHEYAELGFILVMIDGMGTNWRSKAFHDVCWRNLKDAGLPDRIAWIRAAAAQHPEMDVTRVGIFGGSAGGQNALAALLHHGDFYRVAVADCGCHDNRMDKYWWNEAWMGYPLGPWYAENSNVTHADKLTGKLLLVVGELDDNVDPSSTLQVVDALIRADKDFDFLLVPGAGHGAAESPYGNRRRMDFLVRHLHGVEPRSMP